MLLPLLKMAPVHATAPVKCFSSPQLVVTVLTLLLLCLSVSVSSQEDGVHGRGRTVVVYLDTETGNDDSCLSPLTETLCASLEAIANGIASVENLTSLETVILSPLVELKKPVKFEGLSTVRILGAPTQIECISNNSARDGGNSSTGIMFVAVENVIIKNLVLDHCGTEYNYPADWDSDYWKSFKAAIHVFNCTNILLDSITASFSSGAGVAMSNVFGGIVNVSDSLFQHNTVPEWERELHAGGGGIFIQVRYNSPNKFEFNNCTFVNNTQSTTGEDLFSDIFGSVLGGRGRGGGLLVRIFDEVTNNTVVVSNCKFIRNSAFLGGGLDITMNDHSCNNLAIIKDSYFEENGCHSDSDTWSGGGVHLGYSFYGQDRNHARDNVIVVKDSNFTRNCAELGGGTTVYSSRSRYPDSSNEVKFINCFWIENSGRIGAAVDISPHSDDRYLSGFLPSPEFTDCQFINNSAGFRRRNLTQASGTGTLFSSLMDIKFLSFVLFEHNTDSAVIVVNAVANFSCNATFLNNTGVQGGAISLVGVSSMAVGRGNEYRFLHNKAAGRGGAISSYLTDEHDFAASRSCFIQYSERAPPMEWNSTLIFMGNEAPIGRSIFTTAITACLLSSILERLIGNPNFNQSLELDPSGIFQWPGVFIYNDSMENQIATDGSQFQIAEELPYEIIPGEKHSLQLNITDDLNQSVNTTLRATIDKQEPTDIEIDKDFSYIEDNHIQLRGEVGDTGTLLLTFISPRKTSIRIRIVLSSCPVGFSLSKDKECECDVNSYDGLTKCNTNSLTVYIREGFWVGYVKDSLVTAICPVGFCQYMETSESTDILLPLTSSKAELDAFVCGPSRTGILCGDCSEGLTAYYHSPYCSCQETTLCSIGWLLFILSELVPATILFIVVLVCNVNFLSGRLNGFILFSQLIDTLFIDASDVIPVPDAVLFLSWGYRIIYGFFSLDFFTIEPLSFCLWEGATVLDVLAFKYVTIVYSLILIILVIIFMKYIANRLLGNWIKISPIQRSVIHGLSAFLVICYMQSIKVSLKILLSRSLLREGGEVMSPERVLYDGEMETFSPEHLPYAIPALFCLLTLGMIPPVLLLAHPLSYQIAGVCEISDETHPKLCHLCSRVDRLKPILDSFQGCFKDNFRFFAGLYFTYRWIGLLAYATSPNLSVFYTVLQMLLTLILLTHAVAQPYENKWHNLLDALLLTNLALINLFSGFNYYYTRIMPQEVQYQQVVDVTLSLQLALIYLPIVSMLIFLMVKAYWKLCCGERVASGIVHVPAEHEGVSARLLDNSENKHAEGEQYPLLSSGATTFTPPTYGM